uniref:Zinc finger protein 654 n=1 Tax=Molossus molossus TaxID=27622 RepID=A0A7J8I2T7_MOLMO|nr:zinc finger protein 654 [Molossus molossus]
MALIKSCVNHPEISKDLYFHQALFTCLFMSPVEDQLFREHLLKTDCKSGIDIICNTEKEGKTMLALQLCESFLIPQLQNGDMYYIWTFMDSCVTFKSYTHFEFFPVHGCKLVV